MCRRKNHQLCAPPLGVEWGHISPQQRNSPRSPGVELYPGCVSWEQIPPPHTLTPTGGNGPCAVVLIMAGIASGDSRPALWEGNTCRSVMARRWEGDLETYKCSLVEKMPFPPPPRRRSAKSISTDMNKLCSWLLQSMEMLWIYTSVTEPRVTPGSQDTGSKLCPAVCHQL